MHRINMYIDIIYGINILLSIIGYFLMYLNYLCYTLHTQITQMRVQHKFDKERLDKEILYRKS